VQPERFLERHRGAERGQHGAHGVARISGVIDEEDTDPAQRGCRKRPELLAFRTMLEVDSSALRMCPDAAPPPARRSRMNRNPRR
jgi:hypothetical protein